MDQKIVVLFAQVAGPPDGVIAGILLDTIRLVFIGEYDIAAPGPENGLSPGQLPVALGSEGGHLSRLPGCFRENNTGSGQQEVPDARGERLVHVGAEIFGVLGAGGQAADSAVVQQAAAVRVHPGDVELHGAVPQEQRAAGIDPDATAAAVGAVAEDQ